MTRKTSYRNVFYFASVYILIILMFTLFRMLLLSVEFSSFSSVPEFGRLILKAFLIGWRFDTVIACYILIFPVVLLSFFTFIRLRNPIVYYVINVLMVALCIAAFFIASADIPYYRHFSTRISSSFLGWSTSPRFVFLMVLQEPAFLVYVFVFLVASSTFALLHRMIRKKAFNEISMNPGSDRKFPPDLVIGTLLMILLVLIGARGRIEQKSPIKPSAASFCEYPAMNQLALNADYTFMVSYLDGRTEENRELHLLRDDQALYSMIRGFGVDSLMQGSPLARKEIYTSPPVKANVVIIIMESMSAKWMAHSGDKRGLTPNLDSLADRSLFFDQLYSSGYHTSAGIYATLFSYPNLLNHHPLNDVITPEFTGIGKTLKNNGYQTVYFTTHDEMFDNIGGFLRANGYDRIISQKDYPAGQVRSALGVPDHFMFDYAVPVLNRMHSNGKPFLGVLLTASNHDPHIIPDEAVGFKPRNTYDGTRIVEYADWSIGHFMKLASKQSWFSNTIFVFVADHGARVNPSAYDLSLQYFNIPLIIYCPKLVTPCRNSCMAQQVDVFPTLMGLLNVSFVNNTFGIDLRKENRPYSYFCADEQIGCVGREFYLVHRMNGPETMYRFRNEEKRNYLEVYPSKADSMRNYAFSMLQSAQWMVKNKKTGFGNP